MKFYIGIRACGCATAAIIDDAATTAREVAEFARDMARTKRRVEHVDREDQMFPVTVCRCGQRNEPTQVALL